MDVERPPFPQIGHSGTTPLDSVLTPTAGGRLFVASLHHAHMLIVLEITSVCFFFDDF